MLHSSLRIALGVALAVAVVGLTSAYVLSDVSFHDDGSSLLIARLRQMALLALVIERAVEVYLRVADQNGPDRNDPAAVGAARPSATQPATFVALIVGILAALLGVRVMDSFIAFASDGWLAAMLWNGVDILISGTLLAGGAVFMHEIVETLVGGVRSINKRISPAGKSNAGGPAASVATPTPLVGALLPASSYTISVDRTGPDTGRLKFASGAVTVDTTCWWDPEVTIAAANYAGCSKTRMDSKTDSVTGEKRPGIYLPQAVVPGNGQHTIFIHEGRDASWSDGCIVIDRAEMLKLWTAITPMDGRNVTVNVTG
jgi:hypothetical protein